MGIVTLSIVNVEAIVTSIGQTTIPPNNESGLPVGMAKKMQVRSVKTPVVESLEKVMNEKKSGKSQALVEGWKINDFLKEAAWFAANFGLPNEGTTPHKIADVTKEQLTKCFSERTKNGYKLSTCMGIPSNDILALSQVVDKFDKLVNGVLSHTFVKGVYAEQMLEQKVN
ncbi:unnamed protein product [Calypogeia fissa]